MKSILFLLLLLTNLFATTEPCKLDVYFGNGVWNTKEQAKISMDEMEVFLKENNPSFFSSVDEDKTYAIKYIHNETHGEINDLIETHYQLLQSGQISEGYFSFITRALNVVSFDFDYTETILEIINNYEINIANMLSIYENGSFSQNHNVLLIAHSQGNLFGNDMYQYLTSNQRNKFRMISVATPANNVLTDYNINSAPYTTMDGDLLIRSIPNSLVSNSNGFGHTFVDSYLESVDAKIRIMENVNNAVNYFNSKGCQIGYDYYKFISYSCPTRQDQELIVDIYGLKPAKEGQLREEELVTSDDKERVDESYEFTDNNLISYSPRYDKNGCSAYWMTDTSVEFSIINGSYPNVEYDSIAHLTLDYIKDHTYENRGTKSIYTMNNEVFERLTENSTYYKPCIWGCD